jgi:SAM-dependent methyltransferase
MLKRFLAHPLTKDLDLDDPRTTLLRREIIRQKSFLRQLYQEWYREILANVPDTPGFLLELGSGAGFLETNSTDLITSEVFFTPQVKLIANGLALPFPKQSLRCIVMLDVLHHIPDVREFFRESTRCVRSGGRMILIEPWVSHWSRFIYTRLHHEPFLPQAEQWEFPGHGPLSSANGALPWILFKRDRAIFRQEFPQWQIVTVRPDMPFVYLLSGGVSMRSLMPGWSYNAWRFIERNLSWGMDHFAMFALIVLQRV